MEVFETVEEFQSGLLFLVVLVISLEYKFVYRQGLVCFVRLDWQDQIDSLDLGVLLGRLVVIIPHETQHLLSGWAHRRL